MLAEVITSTSDDDWRHNGWGDNGGNNGWGDNGAPARGGWGDVEPHEEPIPDEGWFSDTDSYPYVRDQNLPTDMPHYSINQNIIISESPTCRLIKDAGN